MIAPVLDEIATTYDGKRPLPNEHRDTRKPGQTRRAWYSYVDAVQDGNVQATKVGALSSRNYCILDANI